MWYCYLLRCIDDNHKNLTYGGSTNNPIKRLRQHCGELVGGAKATKGKKWQIYALVTGFVDHNDCLSAEWRMNHVTGKRGKRPAKFCGVSGRIKGLNCILKLDKWTNKCKYTNRNSNFKVYVAEDVIKDLDIVCLPDNVEVFTVKRFGPNTIKYIENDK